MGLHQSLAKSILVLSRLADYSHNFTATTTDNLPDMLSPKPIRVFTRPIKSLFKKSCATNKVCRASLFSGTRPCVNATTVRQLPDDVYDELWSRSTRQFPLTFTENEGPIDVCDREFV